jgi:hypothetical protein
MVFAYGYRCEIYRTENGHCLVVHSIAQLAIFGYYGSVLILMSGFTYQNFRKAVLVRANNPLPCREAEQ